MTRLTLTALIVALISFTALQGSSTSTSTANLQTEQRDAYGNTELMVAAAYGDSELTRSLIDAGAQVNARGRIGNTALIYAAQEGYTDVVSMLLDAGADPDIANDFGSTARALASGYGHRQIVSLIDAAPESSRLFAGLF